MPRANKKTQDTEKEGVGELGLSIGIPGPTYEQLASRAESLEATNSVILKLVQENQQLRELVTQYDARLKELVASQEGVANEQHEES